MTMFVGSNKGLMGHGIFLTNRSSQRRCSIKKGVLKNFATVTGVLPETLFYYSCRPEACNFIKKETRAQVFSCEFGEIFKNTLFTEHLWTTASDKKLFFNLTTLFRTLFGFRIFAETFCCFQKP